MYGDIKKDLALDYLEDLFLEISHNIHMAYEFATKYQNNEYAHQQMLALITMSHNSYLHARRHVSEKSLEVEEIRQFWSVYDGVKSALLYKSNITEMHDKFIDVMGKLNIKFYNWNN
ncbi:hypothetical protein [Alkalihalobacillus sp. 1P02AB]|uniref:hypothetical protein n=1 Tax=Alkalihalobacillus sp. 1P02AB TaxID=3132260 RepID=UPI0039A684ED